MCLPLAAGTAPGDDGDHRSWSRRVGGIAVRNWDRQQSLDGGQGVDHVAHRAEAHDEQTLEDGSSLSEGQDFLGESRERMISVVE